MADSFAFGGALPSARGGFGTLWPIVVRFYQITVAVAQFEIGIGQNTGDAELGQGGAERTKHYRLRRAPPMMSPPIRMLSPVPTCPRAETLPRRLPEVRRS